MIEIILAITQSVTLIALLVFFLVRENRHREDAQKGTILLKEFANEQSSNTSQLVEKLTNDTEKLLEKTHISYLKHIRELEKMILPSPVTTERVQSVLDRIPDLAENDIAKRDEEELAMDIDENSLKNIPINNQTNVVFEGLDDIPTTID